MYFKLANCMAFELYLNRDVILQKNSMHITWVTVKIITLSKGSCILKSKLCIIPHM